MTEFNQSGRPIHPSPNVISERASGFDMNEYFFRLKSGQIGKIIFDGHELTEVHSSEHSEDEVNRVIALDQGGRQHEISYGADAHSKVMHRIIESSLD